MAPYQALVLGLVQGATEFLPVSSSGHLALIEHIFSIQKNSISFNIALHLATLIAIIIFFAPNLKTLSITQFKYLIMASIPVFILGFLLQPFLNTIFSNLTLVGFGFLTTSLILFSTKGISTKKEHTPLSSKTALIIGIAQAIAILPGISRSGSTISTGLHLRLHKQMAFTFSFLLSIPAIIGAITLELISEGTGNLINSSVAIGMISAFISGYISLSLLKKIIINSKFYYFGIYCLCIGIVTLYLSLA